VLVGIAPFYQAENRAIRSLAVEFTPRGEEVVGVGTDQVPSYSGYLLFPEFND
jgi:hypothetical protein